MPFILRVRVPWRVRHVPHPCTAIPWGVPRSHSSFRSVPLDVPRNSQGIGIQASGFPSSP